MPILRSRIKVVAFGWFGTLMNLRAGMRQDLTNLVGSDHPEIDVGDMARDWERAAEAMFGEKPYFPWSEIVCEALNIVCADNGLDEPEIDDLVLEKWVVRWPMYDDSMFVARVGVRYKVAVLCQMERALLGPCLLQLGRPLDTFITSDLSHAFKPARRYFELLLAQLKIEEPDELLIISANPAWDLEPAKAFGYQTLHVDRRATEGITSLREAVALL